MSLGMNAIFARWTSLFAADTAVSIFHSRCSSKSRAKVKSTSQTQNMKRAYSNKAEEAMFAWNGYAKIALANQGESFKVAANSSNA